MSSREVHFVGQDAGVDEAAGQAYAAIVAGDWDAVRPMLHPYLRWLIPTELCAAGAR